MNFDEANVYLNSLGNEVVAMKLGLDAMRRLLVALGNPERNYLKVQVAGTNGKGSVCAFLGSICHEAGVKAGVFTSPHLISVTERIRIDGVDISEVEFAKLATRVRAVCEDLVAGGELENIPTFFEQVTAIALIAFAEAEVQVAILETGLGGRLDATTAANAEIAAITRIDLDHQEYLGETIEQIAAEKAAIIRADSRVVIGPQSQDVLRVIKGGNTTGRECVLLEQNGVGGSADSAKETYSLGTHSPPVVFPPLGLAGRHQLENARVAVAVVESLRQNFKIAEDAIVRGLANARHPGRLESVGRYLLDGAHNPAGAKALCEYILENKRRRTVLIFGAMKGKDVVDIATILFPVAEAVILTRPENSRALTANEIAQSLGHERLGQEWFLTDHVSEAISKANEISGMDGLILITGSLYLVGEVKRILGSQI